MNANFPGNVFRIWKKNIFLLKHMKILFSVCSTGTPRGGLPASRSTKGAKDE